MKIFCIDIGNTHTHFGVVNDSGETFATGETHTREIARSGGAFQTAIDAYLSDTAGGDQAFAFCSVVPAASEILRSIFKDRQLESYLFQLTCHVKLGMPISYPRPEEIGQDRLANAVGATAYYPLPCIVIDMGTAVTFDIVTSNGGYEGGIIAPGLRVMTDYLHEQTALLPAIEEEFTIRGAIGKSTSDAMKIGCLIGFSGMIRALLEAVSDELYERGDQPASLVATGGAARFLDNSLRRELYQAPDLTLQGLARAWMLNHGDEKLA